LYNCFAHVRGAYTEVFDTVGQFGTTPETRGSTPSVYTRKSLDEHVKALAQNYKGFTLVASPEQPLETVLQKAKSEIGKIKIVLYAAPDKELGAFPGTMAYTHATIQRWIPAASPSGFGPIVVWESKLSNGPLIWHKKLEDLMGPRYGQPVAVFEKAWNER
jgi:hypothetical protein